MGADDKIQNMVDDTTGKAKEAVGDATGNDQMESEGSADQSKADLGKAKENVKDAFK